MPAAFVARTLDTTGANNTGSTTPIDSTGATVGVASVSWFFGTTNDAGFTDPSGNTWIPLTKFSDGVALDVRLYVSALTNVGPGHILTGDGAVGTFPVIGFAVFSGVSGFDQESGSGSASATSIQPGSITPAQAGEVFVTAMCTTSANSSIAIDSGFSALFFDFSSGIQVGAGMAYKIQTGGAAAENPTWSWTDGAQLVTVGMGAFTPLAAVVGTESTAYYPRPRRVPPTVMY